MGYRTARRIIVAGDWHGNITWALNVIWQAKELLAEEDSRVILHLGDFGIWPGPAGREYLDRVTLALDQSDTELLFVDGNHEDFTRLAVEEHSQLSAELEYGQLPEAPIPVGAGLRGLRARICWLPRGYRWTWHGRTWLALGGGVSLDRAIRTEGKNWWPQEEITPEQAAQVIVDGGADVMVTHDCPAGVAHTFPPPPPFWDLRDLARNDAHRERLQRVVDAVQPSHLMHGHLHIGYQRMCDFGYGPVDVTGLDRDGAKWNYTVLNVQTMKWEWADTRALLAGSILDEELSRFTEGES
jgi:hypothetical protein